MRTARSLLVVLALGLAACGEDDDPSLSGSPVDDATTTSTTAAPVETSAELLALDVEARTITVDHIELLTGAEAQAEWEAQGGDPAEGPPNDYVFRDDEELEVTYEVAEDATITIVEMGEGVTEGVPATLEELAAAHEVNPFTLRLVVDGDVATEVHQRYTP